MKGNSKQVAGIANVEVSFHKSGVRDSARYVSDTAVHEEALEHGRLIGLYWSATGQVHRESTAAGLPGLDSLRRPLCVFELEVDGQSLHNRWDWVSASRRDGKRLGTVEAVIELRHQVRPVTVKVVTRMDGSPILVRYLEITNTGKAPAALSKVTPWSGMLWNTITQRVWNSVNPSFDEQAVGSKFSVGYFRSDNWGEEGNFVWQPLPQESFCIERSAQGCSYGWPYYIIKNEATGEMFFMGLAWSGNFFAEFAYRYGSLLLFRIGPQAPAPLRVVAPGETVVSPEVHMGPSHGQMDQAVAKWHQHIRASVVPPRPKGKEMYTAACRVVEEPGEWILREADIAAEMGIEAFMVDAGWYGERFPGWEEQRGDWTEGNWLPGGLAGIREHLYKKGMLFGLWHEAETIGRKSRLYKEHPEWTLSTDNRRECAEALDLANPKAAAYFEDSIMRIIRDHKLDFYKLDYNVRVGEGGQSLRDGYAESEFWRHFEALYSTYDRVRATFPDVCLENCASGGGRNDLGMLSRFHYCCESDVSTFPFSIRAINALSLFLPPEAICYYHNHMPQAHQTGNLDTHLRVILFATPIFVGFGAQNADRSTEYFRKTRRYIELHKGFCRPVMAGHPTVYHHTPFIGLYAPAEWCALEYAASDRSRGYAGVFKLGGGDASEYVFRLRGVDSGRTYEVTMDNRDQKFRVSGHELMNAGLRIRLDAVMTSELVLFSAV